MVFVYKPAANFVKSVDSVVFVYKPAANFVKSVDSTVYRRDTLV